LSGPEVEKPKKICPNPLRENEAVVIDPVSMDRIDGIFIPGRSKLPRLGFESEKRSSLPEVSAEMTGLGDGGVEPIISASRSNGAGLQSNGGHLQNGRSKVKSRSVERELDPETPSALTFQETVRARSRIREPTISRSFDEFPDREEELLQQRMFESLFKARSRKPIYASTPTLVHFRQSPRFDEGLEPNPGPEDYRIDPADEEEREKVTPPPPFVHIIITHAD
jgi:hypothetical protein